MPQSSFAQIKQDLAVLQAAEFSPLELLSRRRVVEKLIELTLQGVPAGPPAIVAGLKHLAGSLMSADTSDMNVVVLGGGTGLSTIVGGDSKRLSWLEDPFQGLKMVFPKTKAIVCTTDDGGSTGEMLKDFPLIGLGDIRHVMLSSIRPDLLAEKFGLDYGGALSVAAQLFTIFNFRFDSHSLTLEGLLARKEMTFDQLPRAMGSELMELVRKIWHNPLFERALQRPNCLGNLIITSAIYSFQSAADGVVGHKPILEGLRLIEEIIGAGRDAVLPSTATPSLLKMYYSNGVVATGEDKSGTARRGFPVDHVSVAFSDQEPVAFPEVERSIAEADLIVFAPGSLYTSIVPVMQVPGLSSAIRSNKNAVKVLIANLWVQAGETDLAIDDPGRRFHVSDLIKAYHRNIAGGIEDLFKHVISLNLEDIPGSILQSYAVEGKTPIYLDRGTVWGMGFSPIEASIYSKEELENRKVKHDPVSVAQALQVLVATQEYRDEDVLDDLDLPECPHKQGTSCITVPSFRYEKIITTLAEKGISESDPIVEILWRHWDIPIEHLGFMAGVVYVERRHWGRCQEWDQLFSFYDPDDGLIKIREDLRGAKRFETAFLVALGQSLLGDYAQQKDISPLATNGEELGKMFHLHLRSESERHSYFDDKALCLYLALARMRQSQADPTYFTRVLNANEGFTPPGLLFGLTYAWYLDNRLAEHIEYKMAIARAEVSDLVPEQVRTRARRNELTRFFRQIVFRL